MVDDNEAIREVLDTAALWARDRAETRALIGAVLDSVVATTPTGEAIALINPNVLAELRRHSDH